MKRISSVDQPSTRGRISIYKALGQTPTQKGQEQISKPTSIKMGIYIYNWNIKNQQSN